MAESLRGITHGLLVLGGACLLVAIVFWQGFDFAQRRSVMAAKAATTVSCAPSPEVAVERDTLREQLDESQRQRRLLERAREIDLEAAKALGERLKQSESEQVSLGRDLSYVKRLVQKGGKGVIRVSNLRLTRGPSDGEYRFIVSVNQLIQGLGAARGRVQVSVRGALDGRLASISLDRLPAAKPRTIAMDFEHFQDLSGSFRLPDRFEPQAFVVGIEPSSERFLSTSEEFPWQISEQ